MSKHMTERYALNDTQWQRIESLLPGRIGQPGATARDNRLFVNAVLYRYRAGIAWRDLAARFGDFRVVSTPGTRAGATPACGSACLMPWLKRPTTSGR